MADDAVLAFDRSAILQRMLTGRIDVAGDAHDGIYLGPDVRSQVWSRTMPTVSEPTDGDL